MKITAIATTLVASASAVVAASGGLRKLQPAASPACAPHCSASGRAFFAWDPENLPTLEELNEIYENFCNICATFESIDDIFNSDFANFCSPICNIEIPEFPGDISDGFECFSEISTVQVLNQGSVTMKDLKLGAQVLTANGNYEPVYAFGHKNGAQKAEFLQFQTPTRNLEMTGGHLVFVQGKSNPVRADSVRVGDVLQGNNAEVTKIQTVTRQGVYTPLTPSGTVIVDGIAASGYISLQKNAPEFVELQGGFQIMSWQDFVHMTMSPFRLFTMGVSSSLGNAYTEEGIPVYASFGMDLLMWLNSQNIVVQALALVASLVIFGASMLAEHTLSASTAPLVIASGVGAYFLARQSGISIRAKKIKSV